MKNLIIFVVLVAAGYQGWSRFSDLASKPEPLHNEPYVVVYGRNSCGFTQQTLKDLKQSGIPFKYENIDDRHVADLLHSRMRKSGLETRRYNLPVVDVSNSISVRPNTNSIIETYEDSTF
jgi:glutaredoxin